MRRWQTNVTWRERAGASRVQRAWRVRVAEAARTAGRVLEVLRRAVEVLRQACLNSS